MFKKYTDREEIRRVMDLYMQGRTEVKFLAEIKDGSKNLIYEGAVPMSAVTTPDNGRKIYSLTNSDSGYTCCIGNVNLKDIEYVSELVMPKSILIKKKHNGNTVIHMTVSDEDYAKNIVESLKASGIDAWYVKE